MMFFVAEIKMLIHPELTEVIFCGCVLYFSSPVNISLLDISNNFVGKSFTIN